LKLQIWKIYLQFPYCEQGNLIHWLHKINPLEEKSVEYEIKREKIKREEYEIKYLEIYYKALHIYKIIISFIEI